MIAVLTSAILLPMPSHTTNRLMFAGATLAGAAVAALALPVVAGVGVGAAAAGLAGSVIGGISANFLHQCTDDLAKALANSPGYSKDYLRNEDLRRLVGETVAAKLKALASDTSLDGAARDRLDVLALKATEGWLTVADHASLQKFNEDVVTRLFAMSSKNFANATALDAGTWADFLTYLDSTITDASIAEKIKRLVTPGGRAIGTAPLTPAVRLSIGAALAKEFPHALAIAAKRAFETNHPAYAALQLCLMRDLMTDVRDILATVTSTADKVDAMFVGQTGMQAQLTAIAAAVNAKAPAVGKAVPPADAHNVQDILDEIADSHKQVMGALTRIEAHTALLPGMAVTLDGIAKGQRATPTLQSTTNFLSLGLTKNPVFTGREAEMLALRAAMFPAAGAGTKTTPRASALTQGFTGEGGIGKSQLAQRFGERACAALRGAGEAAEAGWDLFDCAWWLDCSEKGHGPAVEELAKHLGHTRTGTDTSATLRAAVRTKLDPSKRHLLILDNLDELDAAAMAAQGEQGKWARAEGWSLPPGSALLFTTRSQNLPERFGARVKLDALSVEDARTLLRGKRKYVLNTDEEMTDAALRPDLDAVTTHLGRLALAVDMARAYLHLHLGQMPVTLLAKLKASDAAAVALFESDELRGEAHQYRLSVAVALSLHMDALAGTPAEQLLFAAAFAAPDRIPAQLLRSAAGVDEPDADDGLMQLHAKSIVHHQPGPDGGLVSLHRLTQMVVRARLAKAEPWGAARIVDAWIDALIGLFADTTQHTRHPARTAALSHADTVIGFAESPAHKATFAGRTARLRGYVAVHLFLIGQLAPAPVHIDAAIAGFEAQSPRDELGLAVWYATRAGIRRDIGDLPGAEGDITTTISWSETQTPCPEGFLATSYGTRAGIRKNRGDLVGAVADINKVIAVGEAQSPRDEGDLAGLYAVRAGIRQETGDLAGARDDINKSIEWEERQSPRNERGLAIHYATLAGILRDDGDLHGAEDEIQKSINWYEAQLPRDERTLAIRYSSRASIRHFRDDLARARDDIQKCIDLHEAQSPRDERTLASSYITRARICQSLGDLAGAEDDINKSIDSLELQTPRNERSLAIGRDSRASIREARAVAARKTGHVDAAAALFVGAKADIGKALTWWEQNLPGDQRGLASLRKAKARVEEAERGGP